MIEVFKIGGDFIIGEAVTTPVVDEGVDSNGFKLAVLSTTIDIKNPVLAQIFDLSKGVTLIPYFKFYTDDEVIAFNSNEITCRFKPTPELESVYIRAVQQMNSPLDLPPEKKLII